jgi:hypothetical protein
MALMDIRFANFIVFSSNFLVSLRRTIRLAVARPGCDTDLPAATETDATRLFFLWSALSQPSQGRSLWATRGIVAN